MDQQSWQQTAADLGWNDHTRLALATQFIETQGLDGEFGRFVAEIAEEEKTLHLPVDTKPPVAAFLGGD